MMMLLFTGNLSQTKVVRYICLKIRDTYRLMRMIRLTCHNVIYDPVIDSFTSEFNRHTMMQYFIKICVDVFERYCLVRASTG